MANNRMADDEILKLFLKIRHYNFMRNDAHEKFAIRKSAIRHPQKNHGYPCLER